jgi:hypothetical protein
MQIDAIRCGISTSVDNFPHPVTGLWYSYPMTSFELAPEGPFSLAASRAFLEGFAPAAYRGSEEGHLHLAFVPDGEEAAAGVCLRQPDGVVVGEVFGEADPEAARDQVRRMLSLDVDGSRGCGRWGSARRTRRRRGR